MTQRIHTAQFGTADPIARVLDDVACPACGCRDPDAVRRLSPGNRLRFFCDGCGAFVTISLTEAQARCLRDWASAPSDDR